ncbi:FAD-dependent oxidoreductase [Streptomyces sp. L7]
MARHPSLARRGSSVRPQDDVGQGTSKANTAILHTGFDAAPWFPRSTPRPRGRPPTHRLCRGGGGSPVELGRRPARRSDAGTARGAPALGGESRTQRIRRRPHRRAARTLRTRTALGPGRLGALHVPGESIICPWTTTLAYATQAVRHGVDLHLNSRVEQVAGRTAAMSSRPPGAPSAPVTWSTRPTARRHPRPPVRPPRLHRDSAPGPADRLRQARPRPAPPHPPARPPHRTRQGCSGHPHRLRQPCCSGPPPRTWTTSGRPGSTAEGLALLREKGARIPPALLDEEVTAVYAGLRAATEYDDYRITAHPEQAYVTVGGIRSTGLTASLAIAAHVTALLADTGLDLCPAVDLEPVRMPNLGEAFPRPYQRAELIAADPEYGTPRLSP